MSEQKTASELGMVGPRDQDGGGAFGYGGMTLRDWFAGQALTCTRGSTADAQARAAYDVADAMLKARKP